MRLALVAAGLMVIVAVGLMIGLSGFQQYAVESTRSLASNVICAPDRPVSAPGRTVVFNVAGLPEGTRAYWSVDDGQATSDTPGSLSVVYNQRGTKTASVFFRIGDLWERTSCTVSVQ